MLTEHTGTYKRYGLPYDAGLHALAGEQVPAARDRLEHRKDVIGFVQRRRKIVPFLKKDEITHPAARVQGGDQTVIILDVDEVGTTGSNTTSSSGQGAHGAHGISVGSCMFLSIVGALSFYGTYASINEIIESTRELKELREERSILLRHNSAFGRGPDYTRRLHLPENHRALLRENYHMRSKAHVDRVFMGGFGGAGATMVGGSILANVNMFGALSPALAAAATPLMMAATPLVTVFGAGVAGYEAYRFATTYRIGGALRKASHAIGNEELAKRLLQRRLRTVRFVSAVKGASYLGLAIGVPMAVFGGPYGTPVLLASAAGMVVAGVLEGALTSYSPQLTLEDKLKLRDEHDYTTAIEHTHGGRVLLNGLRRDKKLLYPHGDNAFFPLGLAVRGFSATRRALSGRAKRYADPEGTVIKLMHDFASLDEQRAERNVTVSEHRASEAWHSAQNSIVKVRNLTGETMAALEDLRQMRLEHRLQPFENQPVLAPEESIFALMQFMIRSDFLRSFGAELVKDKKLRKAYAAHGVLEQDKKEWHFDANKLVLLFTRSLTSATKNILHTTFVLAERALATTERRRLRSRERQLLDLYSEHLRAKEKPHRRIKTSRLASIANHGSRRSHANKQRLS